MIIRSNGAYCPIYFFEILGRHSLSSSSRGITVEKFSPSEDEAALNQTLAFTRVWPRHARYNLSTFYKGPCGRKYVCNTDAILATGKDRRYCYLLSAVSNLRPSRFSRLVLRDFTNVMRSEFMFGAIYACPARLGSGRCLFPYSIPWVFGSGPAVLLKARPSPL